MPNNEETRNRDLILSENVTQDSVKGLIREILEINDFDDKQEEEKRTYERKPIRLIVNTYGGSVYDGFALVAAIEKSKTPVHTICFGKAMSMGFMIMLAGHKRFAHPLATLMYHQISTLAWGKIEEIKQEVTECERLEKLYDDYVLKHSNLIKKQLDEVKKLKQEWYIGADEAVKLGLVDELL